MKKEEILAEIEKKVRKQGNEGAIDLSPILIEMIGKVRDTFVVTIGDGATVGSVTTYPVTNTQAAIDSFIAYASEHPYDVEVKVDAGNGEIINISAAYITATSYAGSVSTVSKSSEVTLSKTAGQSKFVVTAQA